MKLLWFSCGITSAVACKIAIEEYGKENCVIYYIRIDSAHPDNERFIKDCEEWYGMKINVVQSKTYKDKFDVIYKIKYINGVNGAPCTLQLKKNVRAEVESIVEYDNQVFGFEFTKKEINRAIRFSEQWSHTRPLFPLIDKQLTKHQCAGILLKNGIKLPAMYELGYNNNNCIGCVKGGKGYWNKIRVDFPEYFNMMSEAEQFIGNSCIKNRFLKDLKPDEGSHMEEIVPDCGTFCEIEFADIIDKRTEEVYSGLTNMKQLSLF